jgi:hypothetical protein
MREEDYEALRYAHETRGTSGIFEKITSGVVVNDDDPDQMGRLQIRCPMLGDDDDAPAENLPWAMMMAPAHGMFNVPPIGSLVGVFCLDGDEKVRLYFGEIISDKMQLLGKPNGRYIPVDGVGVAGPYDENGNPTDAFENQQSAFRKGGGFADYDTCGGSGGGTSQFRSGSGGRNRVPPGDIINYLQEKGMTREQALGAVNNFYYESSFNPGAHGDKTRGHSFGLGQWNRSRGERMKAFVGSDWATNWKGQIDYMMTEPQTKRYMSKNFSSAAAASKDFTINWEVPANAARKAGERLKKLSEWENLDTRQPLPGASDEPIIEESEDQGQNTSENSSQSDSQNKKEVYTFIEGMENKDIPFNYSEWMDYAVWPEAMRVTPADAERMSLRSGVNITPNVRGDNEGPSIITTKDDRELPLNAGYTSDPKNPTKRKSNQFFWETPGGLSIAMNDDPENTKISISSKTGAQILLDDTNGRINITSANGSSRVELNDGGTIDIYSALEVSIASESDINLNSKKSIRMRAEDGIHLAAEKEIRIHAMSNLHIKANASLYTEAVADVHIKAEGSIVGTADAMVAFKGTAGGYFQSGCALNFLSEGPVYVTGTEAHINSTPAAESPESFNAFEAKLPTRIPEHHPWPGGYTDAKEADGPGAKGNTGKGRNKPRSAKDYKKTSFFDTERKPDGDAPQNAQNKQKSQQERKDARSAKSKEVKEVKNAQIESTQKPSQRSRKASRSG